MRTLAVLLLVGSVVAGCATSTIDVRKRERLSAYAGLTPEQQGLVNQGHIQMGMPADAVYIAWGRPAEVLESETAEGRATVWVYHGQWVEEYRYWIGRRLETDYYPRNYIRAEIVFHDGRVASWRTLPKPVP